MNPGSLNRRLTLQSRTLSKDAVGGRVESWADVAQIWAEQLTQTQRENIVADAERNQDTRRFRIRYRSITTEGHRLVYQGRKYDLIGIEETGIKDFLIVTCEAARNLDL